MRGISKRNKKGNDEERNKNEREYSRKRKWWDKKCRESKTKLNKVFREMLKGKKERMTYIEEKRRYAKLYKEKEEEEKKQEQKKLLEIKNRNEALKY